MERVGGEAGRVHKARLLIVCGREGEARATVLVLHTFEMHVDLSFSVLLRQPLSIKKSYAEAIHCTNKNSATGKVAPIYWCN